MAWMWRKGPTNTDSLRRYTPISNPGGLLENTWRYTKERDITFQAAGYGVG